MQVQHIQPTAFLLGRWELEWQRISIIFPQAFALSLLLMPSALVSFVLKGIVLVVVRKEYR
jgi:hypothetical protein